METHLMPTYARADVAFARGEGARLFDERGADYIDLLAGIGVISLGHCHPHLVAAVQEQAERLWHVSNLFRIREAERAAARLCAMTFAEVVFFGNSGAEAIEAAIKVARKHFAAAGEPQRNRIITFEGAFHGRTLGALAAGGNEAHLSGFEPRCPGFIQVPRENEKAVRAAITPEVAAILVEPVQGEGGIHAFSDDFLRFLRGVCDEHGILLIFDEIQCGLGRTGRMFACEHAGVWPDIMALAKGLGGGFPVGACLATREAASGMVAGTHGSTFGGNPLAMAAVNAVLDEMEKPGFLPRVRERAEGLDLALRQIAEDFSGVVQALRGRGLMRGLHLRETAPNTELVRLAREERVIVCGAGENVVRLLPPLTITEAELNEGLARLRRALERLAHETG